MNEKTIIYQFEQGIPRPRARGKAEVQKESSITARMEEALESCWRDWRTL